MNDNQRQTGRTFRMLLRLTLAMSEDKKGADFVIVADTQDQADIYARHVRDIMIVKGVVLNRNGHTWSTEWGCTLTPWSRAEWEGPRGSKFRSESHGWHEHRDHYDRRYDA